MSLPSTQKALFLEAQYGTFAVRTVPVPTPADDEVLIALAAAALNPIDWKIQQWGIDMLVPAHAYPIVLGVAGAGTVVALGKSAAAEGRLEVGDRVLTQGHYTNATDTYQQYVHPPADVVAKIPDNMTFDEAATLGTSAPSGALPLYNPDPAAASARLAAPWTPAGRGKYAGSAAVVLSGASSVGQTALQFLKLSGFAPLIATASPHNAALATMHGATHVLDRALPAPALAAEIARIAGAKPVAVVYDGVAGADTQALVWDVVAPGGALVLVLQNAIDEGRKAGGKEVKVVEAMGDMLIPANRAFAGVFVKAFEEFMQEGLVKPGLQEVVPGGLAAIPEALERLKAGEVSGRKLVVHPHEGA